jgi:hypothetical protein
VELIELAALIGMIDNYVPVEWRNPRHDNLPHEKIIALLRIFAKTEKTTSLKKSFLCSTGHN